jgi:hypothetical protein
MTEEPLTRQHEGKQGRKRFKLTRDGRSLEELEASRVVNPH